MNYKCVARHTTDFIATNDEEAITLCKKYNNTPFKLYKNGFMETKYTLFYEYPESKPSLTRDEHIALFWKSFYKAIQDAHGSITSFGPDMTLQEVSEVLAQNGIRFHYEKNSIS